MLGFLLYEAVDVVYNVTKMTYNGVRATYYWYYNLDYPEQEEIKKRDELIMELKERIEHLEKITNVSNSKNNDSTEKNNV